MVDMTRATYERNPVHLADILEGDAADGDLLDLHLSEVATRAACSVLESRWSHNGPNPAHLELLTAVAALRGVLGYAPTPTPADLTAWAGALWANSRRWAGANTAEVFVEFREGPHRGIALALWQPQPSGTGSEAGPPLGLGLPTEHGDTQFLEHGTAFYKLSRHIPAPGERWSYLLDRNRPFPAPGSRPHLFPARLDQPGGWT
ncbi:hypothetical protein [Streptomyces rubiginosohelvolus]|uniref:hypothetical protein n=1 Tax=Streptomyces rubiginosohelvolus TaxID=67362 RepID=UPI0035E1C969